MRTYNELTFHPLTITFKFLDYTHSHTHTHTHTLTNTHTNTHTRTLTLTNTDSTTHTLAHKLLPPIGIFFSFNLFGTKGFPFFSEES